MAPRQGLSSGRTLDRGEQGRLFALWDAALRQLPPHLGLAEALRLAELEARTPGGAVATGSTALARVETLGKGGRLAEGLFLAAVVGAFSGPNPPHDLRKPSLFARIAGLLEAGAWVSGFGSVRVFSVRKVSRAALGRVGGPVNGEAGAVLSGFLREVLERRELFRRQTYLGKAAIDLGLVAALVSVVARARALERGGEVRGSDVEAALPVAESFLVSLHAPTGARFGLGSSQGVIENLRSQFLADEHAFRGFLARAVASGL